jgi:hypothetical protein
MKILKIDPSVRIEGLWAPACFGGRQVDPNLDVLVSSFSADSHLIFDGMSVSMSDDRAATLSSDSVGAERKWLAVAIDPNGRTSFFGWIFSFSDHELANEFVENETLEMETSSYSLAR